MARWAKALYDSRCQVCGTRLVAAGLAYAECAHIRPRPSIAESSHTSALIRSRVT